MNIAFMAHDKRKELLVQFCVENCRVLSEHKLCATAGTGKLIADTTGLDIQRLMSGNRGGDQQIAARISNKEIDLLFLFRYPVFSEFEKAGETALLRLCDLYNVPVATNIKTAEIIIKSLERGDYDWRETAAATGRRRKNSIIYQ
jgi:methylglyoxal synthase